MEVEEMISTKEIVQGFKEKENEDEICTIILKVQSKEFPESNGLDDIKLFGKTPTEWVANAVFDTHIRYAPIDFKQDFMPVVKTMINPSCKWTVVLFNDTPLFQHKTFLQIMEYFKMKDLKALKLTRGYVFDTQYLIQIESLLNPQIQYFEEEDFITCYNLKQVAMVGEVLKNRILSYFMKNGVVIFDPASTFVDADVQIGAGTVIEPFNKILGQTIIENNVHLGSFNKISNSIVCENAMLDGVDIDCSMIGKNATIGKNSIISNNAQICDGVVVPPNCTISGVKVNQDVKLKSYYTYVGEEI